MNRVIGVAASALLLACLALGLTASDSLVNGDWYAYGEAAQGVLDGGRLYGDVWQDKPPLGVLFYAVPQWFARGSPVAVYAAFVAWIALEVAAVWLLTRDIKDSAGKWAASFMLTLLPLVDREFIWPGTAHVANLFVLINTLIAYRYVRLREVSLSSSVWAGLNLVLAFHARQSALPSAVVPLLAALVVGPSLGARVRSLLGFAVGELIGFALVLGLIAWIGDFDGYVDAVFRYPARYAQFSETRCAHPGENLAHLAWLLTMPPGTLVTVPPFLTMLALLFVESRPAGRVNGAALMVVCSLMSTLAILSPMKPYPQYLTAAFPVLAVMPIVYLHESTTAGRKLKLAVTVALLGFLAVRAAGDVGVLLAAPEIDSPKHVQPCSRASLRAAARYIDEHAEPGDDLFVYADWISEPALYFLTRTPPAHKYFWTMQLNPYLVYAIPDSSSVARYRNEPPIWLATLAEIPPNDREHLPVGRELTEHYLKAHSYVKMTAIGEWIIYRLARPPIDN